MKCNICGSTDFIDFPAAKGIRKNGRCNTCKSLERHRALHIALTLEGKLDEEFAKNKRVLQLAPEKVTWQYLSEAYGSGYYASDIDPKRYEHCKCLKLALPDGFTIFPEGYFDLIVHNHVLEHIPGSYQQHISEFRRILKDGSVMFFTIPDGSIYGNIKTTREGGENYSPEKRKKQFGQVDHFKDFGMDFVKYLENIFSNIRVYGNKTKSDWMHYITENNAHGLVFVCQK